MSGEELNDLIKRIEQEREEARRIAKSNMEAFEQKEQELFDLMASILNTLNQMRSNAMMNIK